VPPARRAERERGEARAAAPASQPASQPEIGYRPPGCPISALMSGPGWVRACMLTAPRPAQLTALTSGRRRGSSPCHRRRSRRSRPRRRRPGPWPSSAPGPPPSLARRFHPQLRDQSRRDTGKISANVGRSHDGNCRLTGGRRRALAQQQLCGAAARALDQPLGARGHLLHLQSKRLLIESRWVEKPLAFADKLDHGDSTNRRFDSPCASCACSGSTAPRPRPPRPRRGGTPDDA
jgi:hypothetical protein